MVLTYLHIKLCVYGHYLKVEGRVALGPSPMWGEGTVPPFIRELNRCTSPFEIFLQIQTPGKVFVCLFVCLG